MDKDTTLPRDILLPFCNSLPTTEEAILNPQYPFSRSSFSAIAAQRMTLSLLPHE